MILDILSMLNYTDNTVIALDGESNPLVMSSYQQLQTYESYANQKKRSSVKL